jgi:acetate---CoA ligase (ADP-forming) subunit beta
MVLSEFDSKELLRSYGIPTVPERLAADAPGAAEAARALGFPVAVKLCAAGLAHKTERGLVRLGLADAGAVAAASAELLALRTADEEGAGLLVQRMVRGRRELILGLARDPQFGPSVMLGIGGIFAEAVGDVVFRLAPLDRAEALAMMGDLRAARLLGPFRGEPAVDREALGGALVALGTIGVERPEVVSVDLNPMIVAGGDPVAVDALVEIRETR